ncbi:MAG TPA: CAP domain-containing protein [Gaiellaceae bacterium]|nr:CAP domain-containing protein [Gaiellaceae bacterium]
MTAFSAAALVVIALGFGLLPSGAQAGTRVGDYTAYVAPAQVCVGAGAVSASVASEQRAMSCVVNWARVKRGLKPLRSNAELVFAGKLKLSDSVRCNAFSHTPCGTQFLSVFERSGYVASSVPLWTVGENLAWGQGVTGSPRATIVAWLNSPHHRANLFSATWTDMGIAYQAPATFLGHEGVTLWANEFGTHATG